MSTNRKMQHFNPGARVTAPRMGVNSAMPPRAYLEAHPALLALADKWDGARQRLDELEAHGGAIQRQIEQAADDYRIARRDALVAGDDADAVTDPRPALESELAVVKSDAHLLRAGIETLGIELAMALQDAAPAIVEVAHANAQAILDKMATAARTFNRGASDHSEAAAVVKMLANLQVLGGSVGNVDNLKSGVPSLAITEAALDKARDFTSGILVERDALAAEK